VNSGSHLPLSLHASTTHSPGKYNGLVLLALPSPMYMKQTDKMQPAALALFSEHAPQVPVERYEYQSRPGRFSQRQLLGRYTHPSRLTLCLGALAKDKYSGQRLRFRKENGLSIRTGRGHAAVWWQETPGFIPFCWHDCESVLALYLLHRHAGLWSA